MLPPLPVPSKSDQLLSAYSTFGIGGLARLFVEVQTIEQMQALLAYCHIYEMPYLVIGKGSNCLFDDRGFDGLVLLNKITFCHFDWPYVHVGAGYSFSLLGIQTARKGWSGLEFAAGIPGSVGGAIYMNAGASGSETAHALREVKFVDAEGEVHVFNRDQLSFGYRRSPFHNRKGAIVSGKFLLMQSKEARQKQLKIVEYRTCTQPYSDPSIGCVFRNPLSCSAGLLIQECNLKGMRIGGAEVSMIHGNFIVNRDNATAQDVLSLAAYVKQVVLEKRGVVLEMEIIPIGVR